MWIYLHVANFTCLLLFADVTIDLLVDCSAICKLRVYGQTGADSIHLNDPTAAAVASLSLASVYRGSLLASFLDTGGLAAVLGVLRQSRCPFTLGYCLCVISRLLEGDDPPVRPDRRRQIADEFYESGGWCD